MISNSAPSILIRTLAIILGRRSAPFKYMREPTKQIFRERNEDLTLRNSERSGIGWQIIICLLKLNSLLVAKYVSDDNAMTRSTLRKNKLDALKKRIYVGLVVTKASFLHRPIFFINHPIGREEKPSAIVRS
jgi:hypothetical protein